MRFLYRLHFASWTLLVLLVGYGMGAMIFRIEQAGAPEPVTVYLRDQNTRAPFVHVKEINNGWIVGTVGTGARLMIGDSVVIPKKNRAFRTPAKDFLINIIDVPAPAGTRFVASKRGKNYYPVESAAGQKLSPANRIYFDNEESAKRAGYKRGK